LTAAGTLTGGLVASMFGFRWLFIFMGTLALVSFLGRFDPAKKIDVDWAPAWYWIARFFLEVSGIGARIISVIII